MKIKARKNNQNEYEVTIMMDKEATKDRLKFVIERITSLEKSITVMSEQLTLLKEERIEIENILV